RRICACAWPKLLGSAVIDFSDVNVSFRVHAHAVYAPESSREIAPGAPGVHEVALQIVFDHLRSSAVERPQEARTIHEDQMDVRGRLADTPLVQIFAVLIKHLNAAVAAIVHENAARLRIDTD